MNPPSISSAYTTKNCVTLRFTADHDYDEGGYLCIERSTTSSSSGFSQIAEIPIMADAQVWEQDYNTLGSNGTVFHDDVSGTPTYAWYRARRKSSGGSYTSYSAVTQVPLEGAHIICAEDYPFCSDAGDVNVSSSVSGVTRVRDMNNTSGLSGYVSVNFDPYFTNLYGERNGSLKLLIDNTGGSALGATYNGFRKALTIPQDGIVDLDVNFCLEYYSGDQSVVSGCPLKIGKLDYVFFECYTKQSGNIFKTRIVHSYFGFSTACKDHTAGNCPARWRYLNESNQWVDIDDASDNWKVETFTHWHNLRIVIDTSTSPPHLDLVCIDWEKRVSPGTNLYLDSTPPGGPANNGEFHFVGMQYCSSVASTSPSTKVRLWFSHLRRWPYDSMIRYPHLGARLATP